MSQTGANNPSPQDTVLPTGLIVLINGQQVPFAISANVSNNGYYHCDSYDAELNVYADPAYGIAYWGAFDPSAADIVAEIQFVANGKTTSMITGLVDKIRIDATSGKVDISGRDFSSKLIDTKTQEAYFNDSASQIVQKIAAKHGMTADVDATTQPVGAYYQTDHVHLRQFEFSKETTEWDMLCKLAKQEHMDLYVTGTTLHYKQPSTTPASTWTVVCPTVTIGGGVARLSASNVTRLDLERSLTFAKDISVEVHSWQSKQRKATTAKALARAVKADAKEQAAGNTGGDGFSKVARIGGASNANKNASASTYSYTIPNLTPDEALAKAQEILLDLTTKEREISWEEPGDASLTPRMSVVLSGTAGSWVQGYHVVSIRRQMTYGNYTMHVSARNLSPTIETSTS